MIARLTTVNVTIANWTTLRTVVVFNENHHFIVAKLGISGDEL